ncbi:Hypothetical predicted protein [Paramuricea clavata]|uniref:Uncharacterized protein n=1 Tax=Paramuricea clavata TaxID=317549 RepID=A0A6S7FLG1_PARCT|nr:Hypothetical predicted protein [Paramuricea clavata]
MDVYFQLPHCEINENVLKNVQSAVLKQRITHIIDCEAYTWRKKHFLREVSVLCRNTNIITTYQIYIPNVKLFDENDRAILYQIRVIHGLPIQRHRIDANFYHYQEIQDMLCKIFEKADLVAYKGGNIERDLLNRLNIPCINMEILGCPKYECLLTRFKVKHECCPYHITGVLLENYSYDPVLWSLYATCQYLYAKKFEEVKNGLGVKEIRIKRYSAAETYTLVKNPETDQLSVKKKSLVWLKGILGGVHDLILVDPDKNHYAVVVLENNKRVSSIGSDEYESDDDARDGRPEKSFYIIPAEWLPYVYVRVVDNVWSMYLAKSKFCCRQILKRGDVMVVRRDSINIKQEYVVSQDYFHIGVGACNEQIHDVLSDVGIFVNAKQLYDAVIRQAEPYGKEREVIYALGVHEAIFPFVENDSLNSIMNSAGGDKLLGGSIPCFTYIMDGDFEIMRRDAYRAPLKMAEVCDSICVEIIDPFFEKYH